MVWWLLTFWYYHPLVTIVAAVVTLELLKWKKEVDRQGQPAFGVKKPPPPAAAPQKEGEEGDNPEVVVVGAGAAGLAAGAALANVGLSYVILEKTGEVGSAWRGRYDRLHLHTTRGYSALPFVPFPSCMPLFPSKQQVVQYLEGYAKMLQLNIRFHKEVTAARYDEKQGLWMVTYRSTKKEASDEDEDETVLHPRFLVVATGEHGQPRAPHWSGQDAFQGSICHTSSYKNGEAYRGKNVLVVGFGNSGAEVCLDLWEHDAKPSVLVRSPTNIVPRGLTYLFADILESKLGSRSMPLAVNDMAAKLIMQVLYKDLKQYGIVVPHPTWGVASGIHYLHHAPLIDIGTVDLIRKGEVKVVTHNIEKFTASGLFVQFLLCSSFHFAVLFVSVLSFSDLFFLFVIRLLILNVYRSQV
ncbi:Flavin-containing monooxygenase [Balamuthia mandrillaris]